MVYLNKEKLIIRYIFQGDDWASPPTGTTEEWGGAGDNASW